MNISINKCCHDRNVKFRSEHLNIFFFLKKNFSLSLVEAKNLDYVK